MTLRRSFFVASIAGLLCGAVAAPTDAEAAPFNRVIGFFNGNLGALNVIECGNLSSVEVGGEIEMRGKDGDVFGGQSFSIKPKQPLHIVLNGFGITERYGAALLKLADETTLNTGELGCVLSVYRFSAEAGRVVDIAYSIPLAAARVDESWGIANSFNPDAEPAPTLNWLAVFNAGVTAFRGTVELFDADGAPAGSFSTGEIPPLGRRDFPLAHDVSENGGQTVRMYRIVPQTSGTPYAALAVRYGSNGGALRFGVPLEAVSTGQACGGVPLFVSSMNPALSWLELGNIGQSPVDAQIELETSGGASLPMAAVTVPPRAQRHVFLDLPAQTTGALRVHCTGNLIANELTYGRDPSNLSTIWAYATQPVSSAASSTGSLGFLLNNFLGMLNWMRLAETNGVGFAFDLEGLRPNELIFFQSSGAIASGQGDTFVGALFPANDVGLIDVAAATAGTELRGDLLRVFTAPDGSLTTVMRVPSLQPLVRKLPRIRLEPFITSGLELPIGIVSPHDGSGRLFVLEQHKGIRVVENGVLLTAPFLDLSGVVTTGGEQGVLGLAFHPQYASNRRFYVHYTTTGGGPAGQTVIAEYLRSASDPNLADPSSARIMLLQNQPFTNHNGGQMAFGPDGLLYIGLGDGGSGGDPQDNGENTNTLLGKILRIDTNGVPYANPPGNPFAGGGGRPEIFAYGFRNPFRFSFDSLTGRLFVGDVGQSAREEIDVVVAGGNYGWNTMEGSLCFEPPQNCDRTGRILPIHEYGRDQGISVIGGFVYRGAAVPGLGGQYVFGDFGSGRIWSLEETSAGFLRRELAHPDILISSFGEDENGELFVIDLRGTIYRIMSGV